MGERKKGRTLDSVDRIVILIGFGLIQGIFLLNLQILWKAPRLFPVFYYFESAICDIFLTLIAALFLLIKSKQVKSLEWWGGFWVMAIPFIYLKSLGIYYDHTVYLIAASEGRHIGGGAAMAHVPVMLYCLGPSAILSKIGVSSVRWYQKKRKPDRPNNRA